MTGLDPISTIQLDGATMETLLLLPEPATTEEIIDFFVAQLKELESREPETRAKVQALYDSGDY